MIKRKFIFVALFIGLTIDCALAADKIDLMSRVRLREARLAINPLSRGVSGGPLGKSAPSTAGIVRALVVLADGYDVSDLEAEGVEVSAFMGDVAVCAMPQDDLERIGSLDCVRRLTVDTPRRLMTHGARAASNVDAVHAGMGLPRGYTGKNVVCGIFDQGVDPNHINFLDRDGNTRIISLTHLRLNGAGQPVFSEYDCDNMHLFTTDEPGTYHGTHTLGIMAGGYKGPLDAGYPDGYDPEMGNPYYGMAPDADMMVTCGVTSDYFIANGVNKIVEYAVATGRPTVINLSLGGNIGTHDGNSAMGRFLEAAGKECIIVMAAGNEGNVPLHATKTFTNDDSEFKTLLRANNEPETNGNLRYGQVAIYSDDESVFEIQAIVYNRNTGKVAYRIPLPAPGTGSSTYHITSVDFATSDNDIVSQPLSKYFDGYFGLGSAIDIDTGKFYCVIDYMLTDNQEKNADDMYVPGFIVKGASGQTARMWCDGAYTQFDSYGEQGWNDGTTDGTISDLATARNVVVVGSYNTEGTLHYINGYEEPFWPSLGEFAPGEVTSFSAYGTLADGRRLPHVCAPGVSLVSSTSRHFVESADNGVYTGMMSAKLADNGLTHWWSQTGGTSMAAPVVAGSIALWLEADPTLTVDDVIDIINRTSAVDRQVQDSPAPVQWGAGKFDAYAGLVEVLRQSKIVSVGSDRQRLVFSSTGGRGYAVALPGAKHLDINVYSVAGVNVASVSADGDTANLDLSALAPGVYVVCADGAAPEKFILR